tara:strand:+ start:78 stop:239 length:162 start_codon:yes stop_codon:yes gene_type:complete
MKIFKIKNTQYNLDALKGFSKTKFIKSGLGSEENYDLLAKFINPKKVSKKVKK